jgi:N-carbamoylputrescine amidase
MVGKRARGHPGEDRIPDSMRITVCELPNGWADRDASWKAALTRLREERSDLLVLPEMPFHRWLAGSQQADGDLWQTAVRAHERRMGQLAALEIPVIIGTRPVVAGRKRFNRGFIWERGRGGRDVHTKSYLPNEAGFWEAAWYQRGHGRFATAATGGVKIGFLICTELWFQAHARAYATQGVHLLVCPRVTPLDSVEKWIVGGRCAAVVAGAFCLSSNLNGPHVNGMAFGGAGWIIEPEAGRVMGLTSAEAPILTLDIDPAQAERAKGTYPRYVADCEAGFGDAQGREALSKE